MIRITLLVVFVALAVSGGLVEGLVVPGGEPKQLPSPMVPISTLSKSNTGKSTINTPALTDRRGYLGALVLSLPSAAAAVLLSATTKPALAFDNKISNKYDDRPKRRGPKPNDLGLAQRSSMAGDEYIGLKNCGAAPNCFCSTMDQEEDPDHWIPALQWPEKFGNDRTMAFEDLYAVLKSYPPGQNNVDGGGFAFQKVDTAKGYIYVVYEALKNGYYDDVEFAYIDGTGGDRTVQVRSSSRIGYLDFGVNAKRLNWIAKELRARGWVAEGVDFKIHQGYALENQV